MNKIEYKDAGRGFSSAYPQESGPLRSAVSGPFLTPDDGRSSDPENDMMVQKQRKYF